jgi:kynureninase
VDLAHRARRLDESDPLASFYDRFYRPAGTLYFDGNSLGLLSRDAERSLNHALEEWRSLGVRGWHAGNPPWVEYGERLGARVAGLVGARPDEVVVTGSTTLNLHHLLAGFYRPDGTRHAIVADPLNFPSDLYAIRGQIALRGLDPASSLRLVPSRDGRLIAEEDVEVALGPDVALAVLPAVLYRSGQWLDLPRLTRAAHCAGALVAWDLSHAIGAVPVSLDEAGADLAFWCHYKYLNAGPGAIGGLYVNRRHHARSPAFPGWWGQTPEQRFEMAAEHVPAAGSAAWQIGTLPILAAAPLWGALDITEEAGIERIRAKSVALTSFLIDCVDALLPEHARLARIHTPREAARRGGHVAVEFSEKAPRVQEALRTRGVITDFRPPDVIRFTPSPLTSRFSEVFQAITSLAEILRSL